LESPWPLLSKRVAEERLAFSMRERAQRIARAVVARRWMCAL
jgi:hypothetical protein